MKPGANTSLPTDLHCAVETDLPVLISGRREPACALARWIHQRGRRAGRPMVSLDASELAAGLLAELWASGESGKAGGTLLIEGVERLDASAQAVLTECLSGDGDRPWRLMATASPRLVRLVAAGRFDDRLFYRLNVIHLAVPGGVRRPKAEAGHGRNEHEEPERALGDFEFVDVLRARQDTGPKDDPIIARLAE
ncbi:MAG TPA: sigma 54-interacting transcriptional regulator [Vicinamibacterales bacterium]|nr:sigma 54-interacting transcriptional regulator [Vicinamibacterales bacterium]